MLTVLLSSLKFMEKDQMIIATTDDFTVYNNQHHKIKLEYPSDWEKIDDPSITLLGKNDTTPIVLFSPPNMPTAFLVAVERLLKNITLDEYVAQEIASAQNNTYGFQLIKSTRNITRYRPPNKCGNV